MRNIILILITLLFANVVYGQPKKGKEEIQVEMVINPFGKDIFTTKIKKGSTVKFIINNVNTFKISGITESKALNFNYETSEVFKHFILPQTSKKSEDTELQIEVQAMVRSIDDAKHNNENLNINMLKNKLIEQKNREDNFISKFSDFIEYHHTLNQQIELEFKLIQQIKDSVFINDTLVLKKNVKDYFSAVYGSKSNEEAKEETGKLLNSLIVTYGELQNSYNELNKTLEKDSVILNGKLESTDKKTTVKIENVTLYQERKKYFSEDMEFAKKAFETISDIKQRNEIITKAQSGIDLYNKIIKASFIAYTDAEQINSDEVTLTPKLRFANGNVAHEFKPLTIRAYGGVKVNFSAGYLISFTGDDNYSLTKDGVGNTIGAYQTNKNEVTHALGGLVHAYSNRDSNVQYGLSTGASLATNGNLGFYLGGSIFFLEKNRLVLTGGYSFNKLKKLNTANLKLNDGQYSFVSNTDIEIRYDEVYKGAWFIGVTYNLAK